MDRGTHEASLGGWTANDAWCITDNALRQIGAVRLDVALAQTVVARFLIGCAWCRTGTRFVAAFATVEAESLIGATVLCKMADLSAATQN